MEIPNQVTNKEQNNSQDLNNFFIEVKTLVDDLIIKSIPIDTPEKLANAMQYMFKAKAKRFRAALAIAVADSLKLNSTERKALNAVIVAIEVMHTYSLIHDDLPCMDDDDYRRGQLSCHKKFDEATAILAADAMHALSFELLTNFVWENPTNQLKAVNIFAKSVGPSGMVAGQILDIENSNIDINNASFSESKLKNIHSKKTGALISASMQLAALCKKNIDEETINLLARLGEILGLSFQIMDDLLDEIGSFEKLGKEPGSDKSGKKYTYVNLLGVSAAKDKLAILLKEYKTLLNKSVLSNKTLLQLGDFIINRAS